MPSSDWCTIESDPGVFTSLIESFGVKNAQLSELWSLDNDSLGQLCDTNGGVFGLVFLFKWDAALQSAQRSKEMSAGSEEIPHDLFFAQQVTTNACATQAILSILLNASNTNNDENDDSPSLTLGDMLSNFKAFTTSFPPDLKGEAIGSNTDIKDAHNSFAKKESFLMEEKKRMATSDDDVFHFVAYVPHSNGHVYELDGLQPGPISIGKYDHSAKGDLPWLSTARTAIQSRIEAYATSEIKFNLMALTQDVRSILQGKLSALAKENITEGVQVQELARSLTMEEETRKSWKLENDRRRHNYLPFCIELIKALAKSGTLSDLTKEANVKVVAQRRAMQMKKMELAMKKNSAGGI